MSPRPKVSPWNRDNSEAQRLAMAKKSAASHAPKRESWWAQPGISREEFQEKLKARHAEILNSASDGTRSLTKVT